jgi:K+-sensing histidine kinase KdpD
MGRLFMPFLMAMLVFVASALCWLMPDAISAVIIALLAACTAAFLAWRGDQALLQAESREAEAESAFAHRLKSLRHDVRGCLAAALLMADRLTMTNDPEQKKAGDTIAQAIARATDILKQQENDGGL